MALKSSSRGISGIVSILLVFAIVSSMPPTNGALRKPMYAPGDKWVYVLDGSLGGFPGFNASQGTFHLALVGLVYVNVIGSRSEEHTSELQSLRHLVCRLLLEKKKKKRKSYQQK